MEVLIAFCVVFVEAPRHKGGDALCSFYPESESVQNPKMFVVKGP